jgi:carboxymethylenebutenolidase
MAGQMIDFAANGGSARGYLAKPAQGTGPGVVVVQEWWGLNDQIKGAADQLATEGFVAIVPDMYHGDMAREPQEAQKLMMALNIEQAAKDLRGAAQALKANGATGNRVGAVGFCMGGQLALYAGTVSPNVGAVVDFYGIHPAVQPDYTQLQGPVLILCGEKDPMAGPEPSRAVEQAIKAAGKQAELVVYPGSDHAFMNETRPEVYDDDVAKDAWQRMVNHLRSNLT